jgi:hypothetical protein
MLIFYGYQCNSDVHTAIQGILKYDTLCFEEKYFGLPMPEGLLKSGKFKSTKENSLSMLVIGRKNTCRRVQKRFSLSQCSQPYILMPWEFLSFQLV